EAYVGRLELVTESLRGTIDAWSKRGPTPQDVGLWALYQQRLYLALGDRPALATRVLVLLPPHIRPEAADVVAARRALVALAPPPASRAIPRARSRRTTTRRSTPRRCSRTRGGWRQTSARTTPSTRGRCSSERRADGSGSRDRSRSDRPERRHVELRQVRMRR